MNKLSPYARTYILLTLVAGSLALAWQLGQWTPGRWEMLVAMCVVASLAQCMRVTGSTDRSSYNVSWVTFAFTYVVLGAAPAMLVILVAHAAEWVLRRYAWYIQAFNIAAFLLTVFAANQCAVLVLAARAGPLAEVSAHLTAMFIFTVMNHLLVGTVIWLARGETYVQSGVFGALSLMIDLSLLCLGVSAALVWQLNPFAVILLGIPLYLVYHTLRMPSLERQTDTDPKTGLFNARYLNGELQRALAHAQRLKTPVTVVMSDLDLLRNINNTYGHLAGDAVLIGIADILRKSVRAYDIVARFGGEEFAILMPGITPLEALPRLEAMRGLVEQSGFQVPTSVTPIRATLSMGVAGYEHADQSVSDILHNADLALYHSKLTGRNRITLYSRDGLTNLFTETSAQPVPSQAGTDLLPARQTASDEDLPKASKAATSEAPAGSPSSKVEAAQPAKRVVARSGPPVWGLRAYVVAVASAALLTFAIASGGLQQPDLINLAVFALLVLLTEGYAIDIYVRDASISTSVVPFLAGALLFGPVGVLVLGVVLAVTAKIRHGSPLLRFLFNAHNHLLSGVLAQLLVRLTGMDVLTATLPALFLLSVGATVIAYASSTLLVAGAIALDSGQAFRQVWVERFSWLAPHYVGMGCLLFALIFSFRAAGLPGILIMALPLALLRYSQKQYVDRTKAAVNELRTTNAELLKQAAEISRLNDELLQALAHAIDLRDPYVSGHSKQVARYATLIATEMGLPKEQLELIRKASLLHDIGKLGIPEAILYKASRLTPSEYDMIKQHVTIGTQLLSGCRSLANVVQIVREHHERYDGRGYPDALRGEEIKLEARIIGLADALEAMASDRPYRPSSPGYVIEQELLANRGTQFDPAVTDACLKIMRRSGPSVIMNSALSVKMHALAVST